MWKLLAGSAAVRSEGSAEVQTPKAAARAEPWNVEEREKTEEVRPAEFVVSNDDDDDFEEPEELRKKVTLGRAATERQRRDSEEKNHSVHRVWCEVCVVAARGKQRAPRIFSYFYFKSTNEGIIPHACSDTHTHNPVGLQRQHFRTRSDRHRGENMRERHRENRHQEIHQFQRQRTIHISIH